MDANGFMLQRAVYDQRDQEHPKSSGEVIIVLKVYDLNKIQYLNAKHTFSLLLQNQCLACHLLTKVWKP